MKMLPEKKGREQLVRMSTDRCCESLVKNNIILISTNGKKKSNTAEPMQFDGHHYYLYSTDKTFNILP